MLNEFKFLDDASLKIPTTKELEDADDGTRIICLLTGSTDDGGDGWVFLAVRPSLYALFNARCQIGDELLPEAYGEVIEQGKGLPPPVKVVERMKSQYGFDPHFSERLIEEVKKQQKAFFLQREALRIQAIVATLKIKDAPKPRNKKDEGF